jgi:hypothetical protein
MTRYLNRSQQAEYCQQRGLKITKSQITKLAHIGGGPEYQIWGNRAVSTPEQMDDWIAARLSAPRRSTSEAPRRVAVNRGPLEANADPVGNEVSTKLVASE